MKKEHQLLANRKARIRSALRKRIAAHPRARLCVFRSNQNMHAQIIDDAKGLTIVSVSTAGKNWKEKGSNVAAAQKLGQLIAQKAKEAKVTDVIFDRSGYRYHGRVKALAEAARENGLKF